MEGWRVAMQKSYFKISMYRLVGLHFNIAFIAAGINPKHVEQWVFIVDFEGFSIKDCAPKIVNTSKTVCIYLEFWNPFPQSKNVISSCLVSPLSWSPDGVFI